MQRWSQTLVTRDVDLTLITGFGGEAAYIETLPARYSPAAPTRRPGALPFEHLVVERATLFEFAPGIELRTCSAEDLIVMKLFASRAIDIREVPRRRAPLDRTD